MYFIILGVGKNCKREKTVYKKSEKCYIYKDTMGKTTEESMVFEEICEGNYEHMGVSVGKGAVIFTFYGEKEDVCTLVLVNKKTREKTKISVLQEYCLGSLRSVKVVGLPMRDYFYYYEINGREVLDEYAPVIAGREVWNNENRREEHYKVYGAALTDPFDWKNDKNPEISSTKMLMYKLHVRGFSMDQRIGRTSKGTFRAIEQKIPYLKALGVTTLEMMPAYEFEEMPVPPERPQLPDYVKWEEDSEDMITIPQEENVSRKLNFWGYGQGNYFAVKASYASSPKNASTEYKHLVRTLHENGMECVMEMYFPKETNHNLILDALRFWVREYHVDGFHLLGEQLPITAIVQDVILSRTKIFYLDVHADMQIQKKYSRLYVYKEEYQYPARKLLNHINGDMQEFINQQKKQGDSFGYVNFISSNNGFTLADIFMYNDKHNEDNGEDNLDGDAWNFSCNYGVEGPTRKRYISQLRQRQWRNAILMLMMGQGVPLIWSGDESGNSQKGNNNAYCQDNPVGWVNWHSSKSAAGNLSFLQAAAKFRREHPVIAKQRPFHFSDYKNFGFPDLSLHGENAWLSHIDYGRMSVGMMYSGAYAEDRGHTEDVYVAYNFYSDEASLALPKLAKKRKWHLAVNSADVQEGWLEEPVKCENQQYIEMESQSICILVGK